MIQPWLVAIWPLVVCAALMLILHSTRLLLLGNSETALLRWGAFQKRRVRKSQWWRVITYAFVYGSWLHLLSDIAAIVLVGLAITHLQSFSLAFATFRLGIFVALLGFVFSAPEDRVITSVSGPAFCMIGALLVVGLLNWQRWAVFSLHHAAIAAGVALVALAVILRPKLVPDAAPRAHGYTFLAGIGAALIAAIVERLAL